MDDVIHNGTGYGSVAERLMANGFKTQALKPVLGLHANGVLRKDEWIEFDQTVVDIAQERLVGAQDLIGRGLTFNIPNGMGKTIVEWEEVSDFDPAELTMDGVARTQNDRVEFDLASLPLPITHRDFWLNTRSLQSSRDKGEPLDTTQANKAGRNVSEKIEDVLFNGASSYSVGGATIYGYTDFPARNTFTISTAWDQLTDTSTESVGEQILSDVLDMIQTAVDSNFFGPYMLYIPRNWQKTLLDDFKKNSDKTVVQRIRELDQIVDVKVADKLSNDNTILVQMTRDVVDMVIGQEPTTVQWETNGGFRLNFKALAIMVPRLKQDYNGNTGIVHGS